MIKTSIEYNKYPPPLNLIKVMERRRAENFIEHGSMRFGSLESYRKWESKLLGDSYDGLGRFSVNGHSISVGSHNPVYAWCASLCNIGENRICELARSGGYDCFIRIHTPGVLIERVRSKLDSRLSLKCRRVSYNKGASITQQTLNAQEFHFNVFQKDLKFSRDREYRLSITEVDMDSIGDAPNSSIVIAVGGCSDIACIEDLPIRAHAPLAATNFVC